ncbi:hypothetical protein BSL82_03770 [Tardibacter chloracetimidivorans]|uniref:Uncharacterized protein n=1 Tax=Tardibacter chloracetimidivorans TaxID=1921510 RepID=A0A1L3ZSD7_9SPHN|nr:hypothetical protein [Tardibacter chloracetimidivorans]API58535.1 hypothetical protein BSL82_03770 [Tardibacter chloracetimidivorans]
MTHSTIDQHYIVVYTKDNTNLSAPLRPPAAKDFENQVQALGFTTRVYRALEVTWSTNGGRERSGPLPAPKAHELLKELLALGYNDAATHPVEATIPA